ncbi:hypothetical protein ACOMHN_008378 [Nucella lapillus]
MAERSPDTDSLCALMEECSLSDKEKTKFQTQLADFPHTFQLQEQERLGPDQLKRLKTGLESALTVGYETRMEIARARNLLAYFLFRLNQPKEALQQLEMVLEMEDQSMNLVTLANKAEILLDQMHLSEADELAQSLSEMKTKEESFNYLVVQAKAELAFSYTRLGPSFFPHAISKFEEVIPKAKEPEKWLWMFGLALTKRRLIRAKPQGISVTPSAEIAAEQRDLLLSLIEIAEKCDSRSLKAKTYAELATLLYMVSKTPLRQEFYFRARNMNPVQACEKALKLDPKDNSVLCKCGRILRYCRQTERSKELLETAVATRPSSTGYHHLGITYKALANTEKYKNTVKVPGYYHQMGRSQSTFRGAQNYNRAPRYDHQPQIPHAGPRGAQNYNSARQPFRQTSAGISQYDRSTSAYSHHGVESAAADSGTDVVPTLSLNRDVRVMQRMMKSPPRGVTRFTRDDKFIKEALSNFKKAIEFSLGENTRAMYDLALLLKSLGELEEAKENLQEMLKHQYGLFPTDVVNIYEQMGLILKELAESETDEAKKKHLLQNSATMLQMAVTSAAEIFSKSVGVKEHLDEICHSFSVLLQEVENSDNNKHWKLQEKARLYQLIRDHKQSLDLLQEIEQISPENSENPEYLKLCIKDYVATEQYEKALAFVKVLECTSPSTATMQLFEDKGYVQKIRMHAARQSLLDTGPSVANLHFRSAFQEAADANQNDESTSECGDTDSSEDSKSGSEAWDVAILHEESRESWDHAIKVSKLLENVFGLKVAVTGKDAPPNKLDFEGELRILKKSTVVLVLVGAKISRRLRYLIRQIAKRPSSLTLKVDGEHVPQMLKANRSLSCPPELLERQLSTYSEKSEAEADTICNLFSFLVNVDMFKSEA